MEQTHRKIELQSPEDLTYLITRLRTAARAKLDLHLPPVSTTNGSAQEPDDLRAQTESLVDAFVAQVVHGMRHNISINGLDVVDSSINTNAEDGVGNGTSSGLGLGQTADKVSGQDVETTVFEPYDEKLRARLAAATAQRDALVASISQHRRNTPGVAAARFESTFAMEGEVLGRAREEELSMAVEGEGQGGNVVGLERGEEVEGSWERAVRGLAGLNKGLPETRARLERCGDVVGYLGSSSGKA